MYWNKTMSNQFPLASLWGEVQNQRTNLNTDLRCVCLLHNDKLKFSNACLRKFKYTDYILHFLFLFFFKNEPTLLVVGLYFMIQRSESIIGILLFFLSFFLFLFVILKAGCQRKKMWQLFFLRGTWFLWPPISKSDCFIDCVPSVWVRWKHTCLKLQCE